MKMVLVYAVILPAVVIPILFRRSAGVRVLSVVILCLVAALHFTHLMSVHRLVAEDGANQLTVAPGEQLPADYRLAVDSIQKHSQQQMWLFAALTGGWLVLTLLPAKVVSAPAKKSPASKTVQSEL
jgi:hypothetical protein